MALDTQTFALRRSWLSTALTAIPSAPDIFAQSNLSQARKTFFAGKNQLTAIRNWLTCGGVLVPRQRQAALTELGTLQAAQDPRALHPVTWWLLHLQLCCNREAGPYSTFFTEFEVDGGWTTVEEIVERLNRASPPDGGGQSQATTQTYFAGVDGSFRPGQMLYGLGLVDRRSIVVGGVAKPALRRTSVRPAAGVVACATLLYHTEYHRSAATVTTADMLKCGVAKALGMKDKDYREALAEAHSDQELGTFLQYRRQVNLDSVQFLKQGGVALRALCLHAYRSGQVSWR
jgi:hypothetical protein